MRFLVLAAGLGLLSLAFVSALKAEVIVEGESPVFQNQVLAELNAMRQGKRGLVCRTLIETLDTTQSTTTIREITKDESTWHFNDRRGTRSHVKAMDNKLRGGERNVPTGAIVFLHPTRVDPKSSLFKLGTMVTQLAVAADLNTGHFSGNNVTREKRAAFYRNAWLDSMGLKISDKDDKIPTPEYRRAKEKGLLTEENKALFPILVIPPAP